MRSSSIKSRNVPACSAKADMQKLADYLDSRALLNRLTGEKGKVQSQPYVTTPSSSKDHIKVPTCKPSPTKSDRFSEFSQAKSPYHSPYSTFSNEKSPSKLLSPRLDTNESQESYEVQKLSEMLNSVQKELQMTRNNFIETQNKLEKVIRDQKFYINELEMENLKVTKDLSNAKSVSKKEFENMQDRDNKSLFDWQKKAKEYEEQTKFYIQENIKIKQQYEKEVYGLKGVIKELEGKLEAYKKEFTNFHSKVKKDQDDMGFKEEYIRKLQDGVKEKTKLIYELKQNNEEYLKLLEEKEQKIAGMEKEIRKEKDNSRRYSERISEAIGDKQIPTCDSRAKGHKNEAMDKKSTSSNKSQALSPTAHDQKHKDFEYSFETSLKYARISDIAPKEDFSSKLRIYVADLEQKLSLMTAENAYLRRENISITERYKANEGPHGRNQSKGRIAHKKSFDTENQWVYTNQIAELSENLEKNKKKNCDLAEYLDKSKKKICELQRVNNDLSIKIDTLEKEYERLQKFNQNLVQEYEGKKKNYNQKEKDKEKESSYTVEELRKKVAERSKVIDSLQKLLTKERENFERKWLEQEEAHAEEIQNLISSTTPKHNLSNNTRNELSSDTDKTIEELLSKNRELLDIIDQMERKALEKDQEHVEILLKKNHEISELSTEKTHLNKKVIETAKKLEETKNQNSIVAKELAETQETVSNLLIENREINKYIEENNTGSKALESELQTKYQEISSLQDNIKNMENTIKSYQDKDTQLKKSQLEVNNIKKELNEKIKEINEYKTTKDNESKDHKHALERKDLEISTLKAQVFLLEGKIEDILEESKKGAEIKANLLKKHGKVDDKQLIELMKDNDLLNKKLFEAEEAIEKLSHKDNIEVTIEYKDHKILEDKERYEMSIKSLEEQVDHLSRRLNETENQLKCYSLNSSEAMQYIEQIQKLEDYLKSIQDENFALNSKVAEFSSKPEDVKVLIDYAPFSQFSDKKNYEDKERSLLQIIESLESQIKTLQDYEDSVKSPKDFPINIEYLPMENCSAGNVNEEELEIRLLDMEKQYKGEIQYLNEEIARISTEASFLKEENIALAEKVNELENENAKNQLANLPVTIQKSESQILPDLTQELNKSKHDYNTLKEKANNLEKKAKTLKSQLKFSESAKSELQFSLKTLEVDIKILKEDNFMLIKKIEEKNNSEKYDEPAILMSYNLESESFEKREKELKMYISELEEQINSLKDQERSIEIKIDYVLDLDEKNAMNDEGIRNYEAVILNLEEKNKEIYREIHEKDKENIEMNERICELLRQVDDFNEENKRILKENEMLIKVGKDLQDKLMKLESENTEINNYVDELNMESIENSFNEDKNIENDIINLQNDNKNKEEQIKILNSEIETLANEVDKLKTQSDEEKKIFKSIADDVENKLSRAKSEYMSIKEQLQKVDTEAKSKDEKIKYLELHREKAQKDISNYNEELQELRNQNESLLAVIDKLSKETEELENNIVHKDKCLKEENIKFQQNESKLMQTIKNFESKLKDSKNEINSLESQLQIYIECEYVEKRQSENLQQLKETENELRSKIETLEEDLEEQKNRFQQKIIEKDREIKQLLQEKRNIGKKIEDANKELMVIKDENVNHIRRNEELVEINENIINELSDMSKALNEAQLKTTEGGSSVNESLKTEMESKIQRLESELQGEIHNKTQKIEDLECIISENTGEIKDLYSKLDEKIKELEEKDKEIDENTQEYEKKILEVKQGMVAAKEKLRKYEKECKENDDKIKVLELHKGQLQKQIKDLEAEFQVLKGENYVLAKKNEEKSQSLTDSKPLNTEEEQKCHETLSKSIENESKLTEKIQELQQANYNNKDLISFLLQEKGEMSLKIITLEENTQKTEKIIEENKSLVDTIKDLNLNIEYIKKSTQADKENYESQINKVKKEVEIIKKQNKARIDEENAEKVNIKEENIKLLVQYDKLVEELDDIKQKQEDYLCQIYNLESETKQLKQENAFLETTLNEASENLTELQAKQDDYLYKIYDLEEKNKQLLTQIETKAASEF